MAKASPPAIAYVMKRYPRLSETFILNEICAMEGLGASLELFSLLPPEPPPHHPMVADVRARLHQLPVAPTRKIAALLQAHGRCVIVAPGGYAHALIRAFYTSLQSTRPISVWKQFLRGGFVADRCLRARVGQIHAHFANAPTAVAWFASTISKIPYSFTTHAKDLYLTSERVLRRRVRDAQFVTTCTRCNVDHLRGFLPASEHAKVHLVYHGINLDRFKMRRDGSEKRPVPLILSVGRLVPKKGFSDLIAACAILLEQGITFRCEIVGEGPLRAALQADIARRGLDKQVALRGAMTHSQLVSLYQMADMFALSPQVTEDGDRDGIPNVIAEAMASGVPVVSTAISGIPELVWDDMTGLLVLPQSPTELANAMRRLLDEPETAVRLAHAARALLEEEFDCLETTKRLRDLMCCCSWTEPGATAADLRVASLQAARAAVN